jgi:hypothetical protein
MPWLSFLRHVPDAIGSVALLYLLIPTLLDNVRLRSRAPSVGGNEDRGNDLQHGSEKHHQDRPAKQR